MLKILEILWPNIAIVFIILVFVSLFLWPTITPLLVLILIIVGTGMAITFAIRRRVQDYRQSRIDRTTLLRGTCLDILGILITIIAAVLLGGKAGEYLGQMTGKAVEAIRPGLGYVSGILAGFLAGLVMGLGVAVFVQRIFNFLTRWSLGKTIHSMPATNRR